MNRMKELRVDVVCLIETRVKENNVTAVRKSGFRGGGALTTTMMLRIEDYGFYGWTFLEVAEVANTDQTITCMIKSSNQFWYVSEVYGSTNGCERRRLWTHLETKHNVGDSSWGYQIILLNFLRLVYLTTVVPLLNLTSLVTHLLSLFDSSTFELLHKTFSTDAQIELAKPIPIEEITVAIFEQNGDKAPGPDGCTAHFFKVAWHIVGPDVIRAVILVKRLTKHLPDVISRSQSAFVKGRSITDNILMAQELEKGYGRKSLSPRCALKINLQKAFDSIDLDFILVVLEALEVPELMIRWIRVCLTTPRFSISINGGLIGYFKGARGIRQGDPLSPYLFVISMNDLSSLLDLAVQKGIFQFHPKCHRIHLTHLCFADDLLIFSKGTLDSVVGIWCVLQKFYDFSGLKLNPAKTEIFASGILDEEMEDILRITGIKMGRLPVRYLGVPLVTRRLTVKDCAPLIDKMSERVNCFVKKLSYAGRLQLIQSLIFNVQKYWCTHFFLPKSVIHRIKQMCLRLFWKGKDRPAKGARVGWSFICLPKSEGGLGIKDLITWN
ncbi:hypothetical protein PVK06_025387 [Gossypium arboreum]|uniref:Reverse transcriptase domain-containing protein n=1 Tax=Gossypium arboreum TaxID=29729 RepID=A0ABR0PGP2_GOSAR|nr:hypothetical protein PVK06_025387 [Gossypium arboreum]